MDETTYFFLNKKHMNVEEQAINNKRWREK